MMRWNPEIRTESTEVREQSTVQDLFDTVVATFAGMGARSVLLTAVVVLIVLTLAFGVTTQDAMAGGNFCIRCK